MKKLWNIEWELVRTGNSQCEAEDLEEVKQMELEGNLVSDFGDPDEFDADYDCDVGWKVKSIEEIL